MSDIGLDRLDELQQKVRDDREYVSVDGLFQRQNVFMENLLKKIGRGWDMWTVLIKINRSRKSGGSTDSGFFK